MSSKDTTTPGKPATRSEAVAAALLGLGAVVLLCGVFFGRVQEVTLPGGGGFKLSPAAQATIAAKATEKAQSDPDLTLDPATVGKLYSEALRELASSAMGPPAQLSAADGYPTPAEVAGVSGTAPGDDVIDAAVDAAAKRLTET